MSPMTTTQYPYEVWMTAFHGGARVSRHRTLAAAERALRRGRSPHCTCGCAGIIDVGAGERPGTQAEADARHDPYQIGVQG